MNNRTVLLIEDDVSLLETIYEILTLEGFQVLTAADGQHGFRTAVEQKPGIIITDLMVPKMNGFELLTVLRKTSQTAKTPVILITAYADHKQIPLIQSLSATKLIIKPFNPVELLTAIECCLSVEVS